MLKLLIEDDEGKQTVVPMIRDEITIGRKEGNTIRLTERNVSRRHARLIKANGSIFVEEVAARYGIKLNGTRIQGRAKFSPGDEVKVGDYKLYLQDESRPEVTHQRRMQEMDEAAGPLPIPAGEQARLVVISSNFAGQEFPLTRTEVMIGRGPECDIIIDHRSISGTHAKITRGAQRVFKITDMKSANGVKVNGHPYSTRELNSGDIIELGHVRARFCAPGELWSFQLAAGLVEDLSPRSSRASMILLVAVMALLVVLAAVLFVLMRGEEKPEVKVETKPGQQEIGERIHLTDRADVDEAILRCDDFATKGMFEDALDYCRTATELDPNNRLAVAKYDSVTAELALKHHYDNAKSYLLEKECELALIEIDSVENENSWAARQILREGLRDKAMKCIEDRFVAAAETAIRNREYDEAQRQIDMLERNIPKSAQIARLTETLDKRKKTPDQPVRDPKEGSGSRRGTDTEKPPRETPPKETPPKETGKKTDPEEAKRLADEAKGYVLQNPKRAAELLKRACDLDPGNASIRAQYALALERDGQTCPAYKQYKRAVGGLSGAQKKRAEDFMAKNPQCE